ncbi:MAG: hypothetical protein LBT02_03085 [Rickettsiales bacterium]|jgi:hypothetical protein|nr:hypothetical protein [Rickettsiales bacterium]
MREKFLRTLKVVFDFIKNQVVILSNGETKSFKITLYVWGLIPAFIVVLFLQRKINLSQNSFLTLIFEVFLILYFSWHIYVIRKTLKVQPNLRAPKKLSKKELYVNKTADEIQEIKKQQKKELSQKLLLKKPWKETPDYVIIGCFDFFVVLTEFSLFMNIFK